MSVIETDVEPKSPERACDAVIIDVPNAIGVRVVPTNVATAGFDELNVHVPGEVEVGRPRVKLATLSFIIEMFPKLPMVGRTATIVSFILALPASQLRVRPCEPLMLIVPPSMKVTMSPEIVAIFGLEDV